MEESENSAEQVAINAVNAATNGAGGTMNSMLSTYASELGINVTGTAVGEYNNENFATKNRQTSVANYVFDSKLSGGYTTPAQIAEAFTKGLAYETAKLAFSDELAAGDTLEVADYVALKDAYDAHVAYRGATSISDNALAAIGKVLTIGGNQTNFITAINNQFGNGVAPESDAVNPYKINEVFNFITDWKPAG